MIQYNNRMKTERKQGKLLVKRIFAGLNVAAIINSHHL